MSELEYPKVEKEIFDVDNENLQKLASLFPSAIKDGQLDIDALKEELGQFEEVGSEKYELSWAGKQNAKKEARKNIIGKTLKYVKDDGVDEPTTENLYIEGDNLEVLKLLRKNYYGAIKMIYIDPPYNTGNDFVYNDNFSATQEETEIAQGERDEYGEKLTLNSKDSARYHTNWLNMMYPRLKFAKELLAEDGVIFISIDNNEIDNLKKLCNETIGEENFVTVIHVELSTVQGEKVKSAKNGNLVKNGEYILVYSKNGKKNIGINYLYNSVEYDNHYSVFLEESTEESCFIEKPLTDKICEIDDLFKKLNMLNLASIKNGKRTMANSNISIAYNTLEEVKKFILDNSKKIARVHDTVEVNDSNVINKINKGFIALYKTAERSYFVGKVSNGEIKQRILLAEKVQVANDFYQTYGVTTLRGDWWSGYYKDMGNVNKEGGVNYNNGKKPIRLIKDLLYFCTDKNALILDFFSGSASAAHAIMQLNSEDNGDRKFIMVQLPENLDKSLLKASGETKKTIQETINFLNSINKPHSLSELGKERIRRAGIKIKEENNQQLKIGEEPKKVPDIGFKVFRVADTTLNWEKMALQGKDLASDYLPNTADKDKLDFTPGFNDFDIVYEIMLRQDGLPLTSKIETLADIGSRTYLVADSYLISLEENINAEMVDKLSRIEPLPFKFVFRDSAFNDDIALKDETFRRLNALIDKNKGGKKQAYTVEFI
jgi:adenine-specific DNA-methyltransferase